ncbi:hypothetical protein TNCV_169251 [Trichonephila clavipes]|nr:hypothetical protein TNCV_169251 [Trichonephila clavipes]
MCWEACWGMIRENCGLLTLDRPTLPLSEKFLCVPLSDMNVHDSQSHKGCGSPVVKPSDHGRHVLSSSPVPLKTLPSAAVVEWSWSPTHGWPYEAAGSNPSATEKQPHREADAL